MNIKGLTSQEVKRKVEEGKVNSKTNKLSKSTFEIIQENVFTYFNLLNLILFILVISTGEYKNAMFMGAVIINTCIGIIQELRAKKLLDKVRILTASKVMVSRDEAWIEIDVKDIVEDDLLRLNAGSQIPIDGFIQQGSLELNESLLTGESDTIYKSVGNQVYSGTYILSGSAYVKVSAVGKQRQAEKILSGKKVFGFQKSALQNDLKKLIQIVSVLIIPVGLSLYFMHTGLMHTSHKEAILRVSAAVIGMIPEGLVVLTSVALAVSVIRLLKQNALVQELYAIESLARVDTLCLDKTGTLTQGDMQVVDLNIISDISNEQLSAYMQAYLSKEENPNKTGLALKQYFRSDTQIEIDEYHPFSSERKYASAHIKDVGTLHVGALEFIIPDESSAYQRYIKHDGLRTLTIALKKDMENECKILGFVYLQDVIRPQVQSTLSFFYQNDVDIKVISGDHPATVSAIAKKAGVMHADAYLDMSQEDVDYDQAVKQYTVFGRVLPKQKKELLKALQRNHHTVAMVGDGVNDVPSLKQADVSIAMLAGASAAKDTADIVLLENNFDALPSILFEGRRVINNISRASSMYLVKTLFSFLLTIVVVLLQQEYPFIPVHLTMISAICVGIPTLFLQFEESFEKVKGRFLVESFKHALPSAIMIVLVSISLMIAKMVLNLPQGLMNGILVVVSGFIYLYTLYRLYQPLSRYRKYVLATMSILFILVYYFTQSLLGIYLTINLIPIVCGYIAVSILGIHFVSQLIQERFK